MLKRILAILVITMLFVWGNIATTTLAQAATRLQCGDIFEDAFTENRQFKDYLLNLNPGDQMTITGSPLGDRLTFKILMYGPTGVTITDSGRGLSRAPVIESGVLSAPGNHQISVVNAELSSNNSATNRTTYSGSSSQGGVGVYTLYVGCILRDGTVIEPGDTVQTGVSPVQPPRGFSGIGFPGLDPTDFSDGVTIPFMPGVPNTGSIAPGFSSVFGFTLAASAGDTYTIDFTRVSGNLNLGIAIMSPDNRVVFYGGMITSDALSTRLTLPAAGDYTIGVFRVDLLPPASPETTIFQVTATGG
jgi:hypothetical protein